jgi:hypothetical protein
LLDTRGIDGDVLSGSTDDQRGRVTSETNEGEDDERRDEDDEKPTDRSPDEILDEHRRSPSRTFPGRARRPGQERSHVVACFSVRL